MIQILLFVFLSCSFLSAQNPFHGKIEVNTRWSGTVVLDGDVQVEREAELMIAPGTQVQVLPGNDRGNLGSDRDKIEIIILGKLSARGTAKEPIVFTTSSPNPAPADWYGITLKNRDDSSILEHCVIEYGYKGLTCYGSSPLLESSTFQHNFYAGISTEVKSRARIFNTVMRSNRFAGLICELGARPIVERSEIFDNATGIIVFDRSRPDLGQRYPQKGESRGENLIYNNEEANILNRSDASIFAQNNNWRLDRRDAIRETIVDRKSNPSYGDVLFQPHRTDNQVRSFSVPAVSSEEVGPLDPFISPEGQEDSPSPQESPLPSPERGFTPDPNPSTQPAPEAADSLQTAEWRVENYRTSLDKVEAGRKEADTKPATTLAPKQPLAEQFLDQGGRAYDYMAHPQYPPEYLLQQREGQVTFLVVVARDGSVVAYQEISSDGTLFAEAAEKALVEMRYRPGTYKGLPVRFSVYETFEFKLEP